MIFMIGFFESIAVSISCKVESYPFIQIIIIPINMKKEFEFIPFVKVGGIKFHEKQKKIQNILGILPTRTLTVSTYWPI